MWKSYFTSDSKMDSEAETRRFGLFLRFLCLYICLYVCVSVLVCTSVLSLPFLRQQQSSFYFSLVCNSLSFSSVPSFRLLHAFPLACLCTFFIAKPDGSDWFFHSSSHSNAFAVEHAMLGSVNTARRADSVPNFSSNILRYKKPSFDSGVRYE